MTFDQIALLSLLGGLMAAFALDRWRVEVVALAGLAAAFALGLVDTQGALAGLSDPAVVTVIEILILAQAIGRSRLTSVAARVLARLSLTEPLTIALLCTAAAFTSTFMNNVGALALMLPVVTSVCEARGLPLRRALLPVSFATLLGGLCSLTGTPANLVANSALAEATGEGLAFFAMAPVGVPLSLAGVVWLSTVGYRLLRAAEDPGPERRNYPLDMFLTEVRLTPDAALAGLTVEAVEAHYRLVIHGVFRGEARLFGRKRDQILGDGDILLVSGRVGDIRAFLRGHRLQPAVSAPPASLPAERVWVEAVVMPQSAIIGSALGSIAAFERHGVQVVGISPQRTRIEGRLGDIAPTIGDVILVRGREADIADALEEADCEPLAARPPLFHSPETILPLVAFAGAVILASTGLLAPQIAFGLAIIALCLTRFLDLRAALASLNWPVVVMLAAMLPLGQALYGTGTAERIAQAVLAALGDQPPVVLFGAVILGGILLTPFLNNVTTAVILAPVAISLGRQSGAPLDLMLIAVAVGASTDFLTPFGHHNNTLVMGVGGYRFQDFPKVGAVLTLLVLVLAPLLLAAMA